MLRGLWFAQIAHDFRRGTEPSGLVKRLQQRRNEAYALDALQIIFWIAASNRTVSRSTYLYFSRLPRGED